MPNDNILMVRLMGTSTAIDTALKNLGVNPLAVKRYQNHRFNAGTERVYLSYNAETKKIEIGGKQD